MKKITFVFALFLFIFTTPVYAQNAKTNAITHVSVNGLVCDFCARALEKVFDKEEAVNSISVDLDTKIVTIIFNENQSLDDETITKNIVDAGYSVENIHHVE